VSTLDLSSYVEGWRARCQVARDADAAWQAEGRAVAERIARLLVERYGAERVLLFGSVARGDAVLGSDVDLLVAGIAPERWFEVCAAADQAAGRWVTDLVPWNACRPWVRERAVAEGVVLHG
jgi:predicted nucleotidyltransferase